MSMGRGRAGGRLVVSRRTSERNPTAGWRYSLGGGGGEGRQGKFGSKTNGIGSKPNGLGYKPNGLGYKPNGSDINPTVRI